MDKTMERLKIIDDEDKEEVDACNVILVDCDYFPPTTEGGTFI